MTKVEVPVWLKPLWRGVRTCFVVALVEVLAIPQDWSQPGAALRSLAIALASGFVVALGKYIRDEYQIQYPVLSKLPF